MTPTPTPTPTPAQYPVVPQDLHSSQVLFALQAAAAAVLELSPLPPLQCQLAAAAARPPPAGRLRFAAKRRAGRARAEVQYYSLSGSGGVTCYAPPAEALAAPDARALVGGALAAAAAAARSKKAGAVAVGGGGGPAGSGAGPTGGGGSEGGPEELAQRLGGVSMRLGLSAEERAARERVVLPFERASAGSWERGGSGAGSGVGEGGGGGGGGGVRLGQIHYVRDSEGEADSDEDPDDDLDL
jgi:hypothetical protein